MADYIIKVRNLYAIWNSVIDRTVTAGMTLPEFKEFYQQEYGRSEMPELEERLERVEKKGTSALSYTLKELLKINQEGLTTQKKLYEYLKRERADVLFWEN